MQVVHQQNGPIEVQNAIILWVEAEPFRCCTHVLPPSAHQPDSHSLAAPNVWTARPSPPQSPASKGKGQGSATETVQEQGMDLFETATAGLSLYLFLFVNLQPISLYIFVTRVV
uniref:Uncharacterized protein n=1 Tax=Globodera rostochiensis TaxID=31243 RepID=A0A914I7D9_GLORO